MNVVVMTANLDNFDVTVGHVDQVVGDGVKVRFDYLDDENFPPRSKAMMPRLQSRIPKMFAWQIDPGADYYIWVDSSLAVLHPGTVAWFLEQVKGHDIALFRHPQRKTIREEYDFLKDALASKRKYIVNRYAGELLEEQWNEIQSDASYTDDALYAGTAFIYENNERIHTMMKEWWYHTSRYHCIDQISLPYAIAKTRCRANVIDQNVYDCEYLTVTRVMLSRLNDGKLVITQSI